VTSLAPPSPAPRAAPPPSSAPPPPGVAGNWITAATDHVADLGFTLVDSHRPGSAGSQLVVAFRSRPTERHFDPERMAFYAPSAGRGAATMIDLDSARAVPVRRVLWGQVHVIDRFEIQNRFLSFGGMLRTAAVQPDLVIADLVSPGPIVRWGGHSQGTDRLAGEIGAFFGRLIIPVDFRPGAEARIDAEPPETIYAAFLLDLGRRRDAARASINDADEIDTWRAAERRRLEADRATWQRAMALIGELGLDR
jgi:hypothetical protein